MRLSSTSDADCSPSAASRRSSSSKVLSELRLAQRTVSRSRMPAPGKYAGILLAAAAFGLYLATLSHHHSADSILYARQIEAGDWTQLVDPRHLLLHPFGLFWVQLW